MTPILKLRKGDGRYNVDIDGVKAGWVLKDSDGTWSFYATVTESAYGERQARGARTRREAIYDGLVQLRCWHGNRIYRLNLETFEYEPFCFPTECLRAVESALLDEIFPDRSSYR